MGTGNVAKPLYGRFDDFGTLSEAEARLRESACKGIEFVIGVTGGVPGRPEVETPGNGIRVEFLRFLALDDADDIVLVHGATTPHPNPLP